MEHWQALQQALSYQFNNQQLLKQALTHRSSSTANNNERFEFLGDALLETIISVAIFNARPYEPEGNLTRIRASIVNKHSLADVAARLQLGQYLLLGAGEKKSGGRRRDSILADAVEAIIAAVYLDSDYETCRRFTQQLFQEKLDHLPNAEYLKDAKTQLQEFLQSQSLALPKYEITHESGPQHNRTFEITASTKNATVKAYGSSRKKAEQEAARQLLNHYQKQHEST